MEAKPSGIMETELSVLIADDDANIRRTLAVSLKSQGCEVAQAPSVASAVEQLKTRRFDLVLTDYRLGKQTGSDLIREARRLDPEGVIAVMTAFASIDNAIEVTREGAFDYLPKPFTQAQLEHLLSKVRRVVALRRENERLRRQGEKRNFFSGFTSVANTRLEEFVRKVAPTDATVLLVGESGTGKSELARTIHERSARAERPYVVVNCTSLAETLLESEIFGHVRGAFTGAIADKPGKFELAHRGTLFLDEIGDLSLSAQSKLLRFLQERVIERVGSNQTVVVDARVIVATNKNLVEAVAAGTFREDLYYRLNVFECTLVPIRHRREDLPVFLSKFATEFSRGGPVPRIPDPVNELLLRYSWPGNIREIRNVLERLVLLSAGRDANLSDLPERLVTGAVPAPDDELVTLEALEKRHIERVLARESNLDRASEILGITKVTLWRKRKEYGLP
jgi:NtrC-family two-component system response regulator AlgB